MEILDKNGLSILWSKIKTKFGNYLPLTGGTMTGILYADSAIIAQGRGSNKGYKGYFNNPNYALIGNSTHIFNGTGKAIPQTKYPEKIRNDYFLDSNLILSPILTDQPGTKGITVTGQKFIFHILRHLLHIGQAAE